MTILALKLINNEEIIAETELINGNYLLTNPVRIAIMQRSATEQPSVGFAPFPTFGIETVGTKADKEMDLPKSSVVYTYEPAADFVTQYNEIFGSGIIVPPKTLIVG